MLKVKFFVAETVGDELKPSTLKEVADTEIPDQLRGSDPKKWWGAQSSWKCYEPLKNGGRVQRSIQWRSQTILGEGFEHRVFTGVAIPEEAEWESVDRGQLKSVMRSELAVPWDKMTRENQRRCHGMAMAYWEDRD